MVNKKKQERLVRFTFVFVGLILVLFGAAKLLKGETNYSNYWGELVFAPVAILVGILALYISLFRWKRAKKNIEKSKPVSPMDDFRKW